MSDDPRMADIRARLLRPASVEEVRDTLLILDELSATPESAEEGKEGLRRAFECLRELTSAKPDSAVQILTSELLPRCLVPDRENYNAFGDSHSYTFGKWLGDLPEDHRHRVRVATLPRAIAALGGDGVRNSIRLISCVGYWDDDVLGALDRFARCHDDEAGDQALSARVALLSSLEPAVHELYLEMLHKRIPRGPNLHQLLCGRVIGTAETAELVWSHWLTPTNAQSPERSLFASFAQSLLVEIATRVHDTEFTTRVWNRLVQLSRRSNKGIEEVFGQNSSLVNRLDIPAVIPELIGLAIRAKGHHRYMYYLRTLECERPAHMVGWDAVAHSELEVVRVDAVEPTRMRGRGSTIELYKKEAAWDVLLCRGEPSALPLIENALVEESGYVAHRFLELAACLRLDPLPGMIGALLAGSTDVAAWDENERFVAQIGAIEAAHGAGTRESFNALLGYRQIGKGVLLSVVAALAETARIVLEGGDRSPVEQLLLIAENSPLEDSKGAAAAAAAAVAGLLEGGALTTHEAARAAALLQQPSTDPYARRELLFALAGC